LGITAHPPKLAKAYAALRATIADAARTFAAEVAAGTFPDEDHAYH
jgi:3-methyl-2-oxobutanoate hydroxymethyltransferase